jgi:lysophospholipase L1-like esterase
MKRMVLSIVLSVLVIIGVPMSAFAASDPIKDGLYEGLAMAAGTSASTNKGYNYVALGDSVAAGIGLQGAYGTAACGKTAQAYSVQVAKYLKSAPVSFACSGATAGDLVTQQHIPGPNPPAQLTNAFAKGTPKVITITAGANDIHWSDFIKKCFGSTCGTQNDTDTANALLVGLQYKLTYAMGSIQRRSNYHPPKVYLTGYYNPLSANCQSSQLSAAELAWLNAESQALNQTIKNVAKRYSFAEFVPVDFTGHDICSASPWIQGPSDPAPFHPNATGQAVIAKSVIRAMKN